MIDFRKTIKAFLKLIYIFFWRIISKLYSPILIKKYINQNKVLKLHIGSGKNVIKDWLNCDISPLSFKVVFADVRNKFLINDNVIDYIFSEHMIEHINYKDGLKMLTECYRVLKPGGKIRITTPDLNTLIEILKNDKNIYDNYIKWSHKENNLINANSIEVFNNFFQSWGHKFIYDKNFLKTNLQEIGFKNLKYFKLKISDDYHFENLEHAHRLPENFLQIESFTIEGTK